MSAVYGASFTRLLARPGFKVKTSRVEMETA